MVHTEGSAGRKLVGSITAGGAATRKALTMLLGLEGSGLPYRVRAAAWKDQALVAAVTLSDDKELLFSFDRRTDETEGIIKTAHVVVSYSGGDVPRDLVEVLEAVGAPRIADYDMERLAGLLAADPEAGKPGLPVPSRDEQDNRPRSLLDTWGESDAYADFFAGGEIARSQLDSLDPTNLFVFVQHSDQECNHVNPHSVAPIMWLVNYPWEERTRWDRAARPEGFTDFTVVDSMLSTDLTENDVIMGNPDKVRRVLQKGVEVSKKLDKTLFFSNTCVPVVTGEDVESEVKRARGGCEDCPILYLTVTPRAMVNVFHDILVTKRLEAEAKTAPRGDNVVNLVGYPRNRAHDELEAMLSAVGIERNVSLLPDLNFDLVEELPQGALNVFLSNSTWQHLYDQLTFESRTPFISPLPPYGLAGSRTWLQAILDALQLDGDVEGALESLTAPLQDRWDRLVDEAKGYRVALVIRASETYYLTKPTFSWGVPIVAALEEMGFSIDVLLKLDSREEAAKAAREVHGTFAHPERHTIKGFNTMEMMFARLKETPSNALLTYHFFDWRATQAGMNAFSLQQFEPGVAGALRTLERLVGICRTPYFQRYAKYLQRTPEGLRAPPVGGASRPDSEEA
jgi:nitrogenase molybdenum-iron protein alpha/beta subunit